jgi:hypothetical protein
MEIYAEQLTPEHLLEYWEIEAVGGLADEPVRETVWRSKRLLPFQSANSAGTLLKTLRIRLPSLDQGAVEDLRDKIKRLEAGTA